MILIYNSFNLYLCILASAKIVSILNSRYDSIVIEKASIDEVYLDVTKESENLLDSINTEELLRAAIEEKWEGLNFLIAGEDNDEVILDKSAIRRGHRNQHNGISTSKSTSTWFNRPFHLWTIEDRLIICGAIIISELRYDVYKQLGFTCSAGIARNKMLAKTSSGMHKPNKQTLVPNGVIPCLLSTLPFNRIQGFGGKLGESITNIYEGKVKTLGN